MRAPTDPPYQECFEKTEGKGFTELYPEIKPEGIEYALWLPCPEKEKIFLKLSPDSSKDWLEITPDDLFAGFKTVTIDERYASFTTKELSFVIDQDTAYTYIYDLEEKFWDKEVLPNYIER